MTKTRVYPIRTTKKEWSIPIYCKHICDINCSKIYSRDRSNLNINRYVLIDNPTYIDGKCKRYNDIERTFVRLCSFNPVYSLGCTGPLYEPDNIVIPDNNLYILLTFPLTTPVNVHITSNTNRGFTLRELIYSIKMVYKYIYQEEERTSTPRTYSIKKRCTKCIMNKNQDYVKDVFSEDKKNECSICYTNYLNKSDAGQLLCKHIFHKSCISKWIGTSKTCPLCRQYVDSCSSCNGAGFIYYDYNGVVIPKEHRVLYLNRNTTDGIFGIFGHDLDDLIIENMYYNRETKILILNIGC